MLIGDAEGLRIDTREMESEQPVFTIDSLEAIASELPGVELHLLLGEDSFQALDGWRDPDGIARLCELVVAPRGGAEDAAARPRDWRGTAVHWLDGFQIDLSSTRVRESLRATNHADGLPAEVVGYIRAHALYRAERQ
jgi:nicotinate-nucleotide adenylyltransferase